MHCTEQITITAIFAMCVKLSSWLFLVSSKSLSLDVLHLIQHTAVCGHLCHSSTLLSFTADWTFKGHFYHTIPHGAGVSRLTLRPRGSKSNAYSFLAQAAGSYLDRLCIAAFVHLALIGLFSLLLFFSFQQCAQTPNYISYISRTHHFWANIYGSYRNNPGRTDPGTDNVPQ